MAWLQGSLANSDLKAAFSFLKKVLQLASHCKPTPLGCGPHAEHNFEGLHVRACVALRGYLDVNKKEADRWDHDHRRRQTGTAHW